MKTGFCMRNILGSQRLAIYSNYHFDGLVTCQGFVKIENVFVVDNVRWCLEIIIG